MLLLHLKVLHSVFPATQSLVATIYLQFAVLTVFWPPKPSLAPQVANAKLFVSNDKWEAWQCEQPISNTHHILLRQYGYIGCFNIICGWPPQNLNMIFQIKYKISFFLFFINKLYMDFYIFIYNNLFLSIFISYYLLFIFYFFYFGILIFFCKFLYFFKYI